MQYIYGVIRVFETLFHSTIAKNAIISPCLEEIGPIVSISTCVLVCSSNCFKLFGIASVIKDLWIRNRELLVPEAF